MSGAAASAPAVRAFAHLAFLDLLAYRVRYVVGILNYVIYMGVQYFLWSAVYASAPAGPGSGLGGFAFAELMTYFAVGWIVRVSYFNNIDRELAERISRGDILLDLLRPVSLLSRFYGQALGESLFRVFFMGLPAALVLFPLFGAKGPAAGQGAAAALTAGLAFVASAVLAFHVFFLLNFLVGLSAVFFEKVRGFLWAKFILVQLLSGLLVPFDLFPGWARQALSILPFRATVYSPSSIYTGRLGGAALLGELGLQAGWTLLLYLAARASWAACQRRLLIQGG